MTDKNKNDLQSLLLDIIPRLQNLELIAECADLLALDARFNFWVATIAKFERNNSMLDLIGVYSDVVTDFRESLDDLDGLRSAIARASKKLREAMR